VTDSRSLRASEIAAAAAELEGEAREQYLLTACAGDDDLRTAVQRYLEAPPPSDFLAPPRPGARVDGGTVAGLQLTDFELLAEIGRGGMGVVYRARQRSLDRIVALKILTQVPGLPGESLARFRRETLAATRVYHPNLVPILATDDGRGPAWYAMPLIDGHDLGRELHWQRQVAQGQAGEERLLLPAHGSPGYISALVERLADVAEALDTLHQQRILHRDVKPQNLLIDRGGRLLLTDLGLAKVEDQPALTREAGPLGTFEYMSPEQARAIEDPIDRRTDIYSLSAVLYEALCLQRAVTGRNLDETLARIRSGERLPLRRVDRRVPRDLALVCETGLARRPADRYPSMAEFAADLRRFLRHEAVHVQPPSPATRLRRWVERRRRPVALAAGALLLCAASLWAGAVRAEARRRPQVEFLLSEGAAALGPWRAEELRLDPLTSELLEALDWGDLPRRARRVDPGLVRFRLRSAGGELREYTRWLVAGAPPSSIRVDVAARSEVPRRAAYGATVLEYPQRAPSPSPFAGRRVAVAAFELDLHEVTVGEYRVFLEATGARRPEFWERLDGREYEDRPVAGISGHEAQAYAEWAGLRLPTLGEYWAATRGAENRRLPYAGERPLGAVDGPALPVGSRSGVADAYLQETVAAASLPETANAEGALHLLGNVQEWTESLAFAVRSDGELYALPERRVLVGGDWTVGLRDWWLEDLTIDDPDPSFAQWNRGFRCARSIVD
jgi:serine/threonine protein kinase